MLDIDKFLTASGKDLESISWYEMMSKLGLLSFNAQGNKPIEIIANLTRITESSTVLIVGCGAGGTAVHLAELTQANVYGVDIAPESIRQAIELASKSSASQKLHFQVGDAHSLSFPHDMFDVVITEYMAFFLQANAFKGFFQILKVGGQIALAELMKDPKVNKKADAKILAAEEIYCELLGYKFHIPLINEYIEILTKAGFDHIQINDRFPAPKIQESIKFAGGWKILFKIIKVMLKLMRESPVLKKKFFQMGKVKRVLYQDPSTAKFIYQSVLIGQKS